LVLREQLSSGVGGSVGAAGGSTGAGSGGLRGHRGVALTDLRPAGKAEVGGRVIDVTCDGFIAAGSRVEVVEESAFRVVVRKATG
jgi:membrane-bound serine protease (ClpP class)